MKKASIESINFINIIPVRENMLITSSCDGYIKIWKFPKIELACSLRIDRPLPNKWDINHDLTITLNLKCLML